MTTERMAAVVTAMATMMILTAGATPAAAQVPLVKDWTDRGFVNINGGTQSESRRVTTAGSQPIFEELATWNSSVEVGSAGIVDFSAGYRVWRNVAGAIGYSRYRDRSSAPVSAVIPDALIFDMPHAESLSVGGLAHTEHAVHLSAVLVMPQVLPDVLPGLDRLDVSIFAGPSFFSVKKDIVTDVSLVATLPNLAGGITTRLSETATGGHIALDIRYRLLEQLGPVRNVGVGVFVRYAAASFDASPVGKVDVGGLHYGGGVRIGF